MSETLTLPLKREYFEKIRDGLKPFEFRQMTEYWKKRIVCRDYQYLELMMGYPRRGDFDRRMRFIYKGYEIQRITHPHFGNLPQDVFAIRTNIKHRIPHD